MTWLDAKEREVRSGGFVVSLRLAPCHMPSHDPEGIVLREVWVDTEVLDHEGTFYLVDSDLLDVFEIAVGHIASGNWDVGDANEIDRVLHTKLDVVNRHRETIQCELVRERLRLQVEIDKLDMAMAALTRCGQAIARRRQREGDCATTPEPLIAAAADRSNLGPAWLGELCADVSPVLETAQEDAPDAGS